MSQQNDIPWIEKYRPVHMSDIKGNNLTLNTLDRMIENNNLAHIIFYGPSGTGKTSTILACARKLYKENYKSMVLELNGSEDRGINIIRDQIKDFSTSSQFNKMNINFKLIILDEADSMTYDAQFALRRVIETYSQYTRFCLICNYENKIIAALKSRCIIFKFPPLSKIIQLEKLKDIIINENINISKSGIEAIINLSDGDMRKSINLLQSLYIAIKKQITKYQVYKYIKYPNQTHFNKLIDKIFNLEISLIDISNELYNYKINNNISIQDILSNIVNYLIKNIKNINQYTIINIFDKLGDIEIFISIYHNEKLIITNIISIIRLYIK